MNRLYQKFFGYSTFLKLEKVNKSSLFSIHDTPTHVYIYKKNISRNVSEFSKTRTSVLKSNFCLLFNINKKIRINLQ